MSLEFQQMGLQPQILQAVSDLGFTLPTPIQEAAIPALLGGSNVLGQAQTGTGKTAAFGLPMLQQIEPGKYVVQALVMAPTRELAIQVTDAIAQMARHTSLRILTVYGGQPYRTQTRELERGVDVVVGTPGRLLDLIHKSILDLSQVKYLVLDEADEMLEMGFIEDVEAIMAEIQPERQTALFSATLPEAIRKLARRFILNPVEIKINPSHITVAETEQRYCRVRDEDKLEALVHLLEAEEVKSALIFARTKARAQDLADSLIQRGYPSESLHGDLTQARREFVLHRFRQSAITLLVATDVAARGLDIEDVSHVINFDIPADGEDYVHRIGRTGRAGRKGVAISLVCPRERGRLREIEAYTHQAIAEFKVPNREEIQARRDERYLQRLTETLRTGSFSNERDLVGRLMEADFDLVDIAAAAIQMARAMESELSLREVQEPSESLRRTTARDRSRNNSREAQRDWHGDAVALPLARGQSSGRKGRYTEAGMVRLRMNLGQTHGLRPGDVVGAIAGEVGIPGRAIGQIDIHENHTFVDVAENHVGHVLAESTGKYFLRGKAVQLTLAN